MGLGVDYGPIRPTQPRSTQPDKHFQANPINISRMPPMVHNKFTVDWGKQCLIWPFAGKVYRE